MASHAVGGLELTEVVLAARAGGGRILCGGARSPLQPAERNGGAGSQPVIWGGMGSTAKVSIVNCASAGKFASNEGLKNEFVDPPRRPRALPGVVLKTLSLPKNFHRVQIVGLHWVGRIVDTVGSVQRVTWLGRSSDDGLVSPG